jgi:large conductance mechanosensitive channel
VFKGFKNFVLRGNLVDLAVAVVIGAAFSTVIQAFVKDLITPLIGIFGGFSFPNWSFTLNKSVFQVGDFINSFISFLIVAFVVFFFVVRPVAFLLDEVKKHEKKQAAITRECPYCFNAIPIKATRCGFCTSEVVAAAAAATAVVEAEKQ